MSNDADLATAYAAAVATADASAVSAKPEAQLTVSVAVSLESLAAAHGLGALLLREAQQSVRPDFAAPLSGRPCGWVELEAPGHSLDGPAWAGRKKKQWVLLAPLDVPPVCDGQDLPQPTAAHREVPA